MEEIFNKIKELQKSSIDKTIDYIFETLDNKLFESDFEYIDKFLNDINVDDYIPSALIAILTITSDWVQLKNRENFYNQVEEILNKEILKGLEE